MAAKKHSAERVVVTGMGVVSPLAIGVEAFHSSLLGGRTGIVPFTPPWPTGYKSVRAGLVVGFEAAGVPSCGRASQMALVASKQALDCAGIGVPVSRPERIGVVAATALGDAPEFETCSDTGVNGNASVDWMRIGSMADRVARAVGVEGPVQLVMTTCAAGNHAISWSASLLTAGAADAMLAVASDALGYVDLLGFCRLLLQAPERCQPFDLYRKGTVLAEGAAAVVLETLSTAESRGATVLAEILGSGESCDAAGPFASNLNDMRGMQLAFERAIRAAEISADEIDHVSAHGSGTKLNDRKETAFLKTVLGARAYKVPTSAIKSMLGHAQGAASMFEAIASILSLQHDCLYPTINYETPDPFCDLDYVPNCAREHRVRTIMSNAFGVGGNNSIVIFRRWPSC
jgi:3-oxoacyl-[acyl-carrier-protein] synthase II